MPYSLHDHIMALVKAQQEHNNVAHNTNGKPNTVSPTATANITKQTTDPHEPFFLSWGSYNLTLSRALCAQLDRYCAANPMTLRYKPSSNYADRNGLERPMSRSKVIRRAVYALMDDPNLANTVRRSITGLPPDRPIAVSWTMPQNKRPDTERFKALCRHVGAGPTTFTRIAVYLYTVMHKSTDKDEHMEAVKDVWC